MRSVRTQVHGAQAALPRKPIAKNLPAMQKIAYDAKGEEVMKYPIVCICGSTRFQKETVEMAESLTLAGQIVLMVNCWSRKDALHEPQNDVDREIKEMLDDIHKEKIRLADYVLVMNIGGYVGNSTESEIDFARRIGKPITFVEKVKK